MVDDRAGEQLWQYIEDRNRTVDRASELDNTEATVELMALMSLSDSLREVVRTNGASGVGRDAARATLQAAISRDSRDSATQSSAGWRRLSVRWSRQTILILAMLMLAAVALGLATVRAYLARRAGNCRLPSAVSAAVRDTQARAGRCPPPAA